MPRGVRLADMNAFTALNFKSLNYAKAEIETAKRLKKAALDWQKALP